jgi:hypothetical protein
MSRPLSRKENSDDCNGFALGSETIVHNKAFSPYTAFHTYTVDISPGVNFPLVETEEFDLFRRLSFVVELLEVQPLFFWIGIWPFKAMSHFIFPFFYQPSNVRK